LPSGADGQRCSLQLNADPLASTGWSDSFWRWAGSLRLTPTSRRATVVAPVSCRAPSGAVPTPAVVHARVPPRRSEMSRFDVGLFHAGLPTQSRGAPFRDRVAKRVSPPGFALLGFYIRRLPGAPSASPGPGGASAPFRGQRAVAATRRCTALFRSQSALPPGATRGDLSGRRALAVQANMALQLTARRPRKRPPPRPAAVRCKCRFTVDTRAAAGRYSGVTRAGGR